MTAPLTLALVGLISVAGSFVQASTGFGYAVTVMALWPLFLPYKTALVVELLAALADEASRLKSAYYKEDAAVRRAEHLLDRVPDAVCREVLRLRYLDVLPWTKVQFHMARSGMSYSLRHLHRLHDTGVDLVQREMDRRKKKADDPKEAEE